MFVSGMKKPLLTVALVLAVALAACGDFENDYNQSSKTGPSNSPTVPGGYYFDLTLSPSLVQLGGEQATITITTHVWDANGVGVASVPVSYGGDFTLDGTAYVTDSDGYSTVPLSITGIVTEGVRKYVTATVEDVILTVSYKSIPVGGI